jgi:DNA topoisomerase-1
VKTKAPLSATATDEGLVTVVAAVEQGTDPGTVASAKAAGLRYVMDTAPGLTRRKTGSGFGYRDAGGGRVRDKETLERIRKLAIPPAWTEVWICPHPNGHLQATGRDARKRKQYRYHARWREVRDDVKYGRMLAFGAALPIIRKQTRADLQKTGLPREKVLAALVQLLEKTLIRVGNEEYARTNKSFGLTTMRDRHVDVKGSTVRFEFRAKSGIQQSVDLMDPKLAKTVKRCQDLPGQTLFQYIDEDGAQQTVDSGDVNDYVREMTGQEFTAKDFRTWAGTVLAACALRELREFTSETEAKRNIVQAIESVAKRLGNTKAVCRKCYVHPAVLDAYLDGTTIDLIIKHAGKLRKVGGLSRDEVGVLALLQHRLLKQQKQRRQPPRRRAA